MIGYTKTFRTSLALGKGADDVTPTITRALESFNSDDGFAALRQRIESAGKSWSSIYETQQLQKLLCSLHADKQLIDSPSADLKGNLIPDYFARSGPVRNEGAGGAGPTNSRILTSFGKMTGDVQASYGLANLDSLSAKRQRTLPTDCKVYDTLNFATEVATHYATPKAARRLQAWVGQSVAEEFDMEGTVDHFEDFDAFLVDSKLKTGVSGSENSSKQLALTN